VASAVVKDADVAHRFAEARTVPRVGVQRLMQFGQFAAATCNLIGDRKMVALPTHSARRPSLNKCSGILAPLRRPLHWLAPISVDLLQTTQMHRPIRQGGGGPPQPPGPPKPRPPKPGPPKPRPPRKPPPPPCQPPPRPPPPQPANCAWWTTPGAACGVGAAFATPARPRAEKPSAPAITPAPTMFFRIMTIPFSV
jgi:hypothetical protein